MNRVVCLGVKKYWNENESMNKSLYCVPCLVIIGEWTANSILVFKKKEN